jgi:hypothetical protein
MAFFAKSVSKVFFVFMIALCHEFIIKVGKRLSSCFYIFIEWHVGKV